MLKSWCYNLVLINFTASLEAQVVNFATVAKYFYWVAIEFNTNTTFSFEHS